MPFYQLASGINLFFKLEGDLEKPLIVLYHGFGSDLTSFDHILPFLINNFCILRWDHRGHGKSDKPEPKPEINIDVPFLGTYSIQQFALDIHELLIGLNLIQRKSIFHYGHSMGGMILLQFLVYFPNICTAIVVGSTSPGGKTPELQLNLNLYLTGKVKFDRESFNQSTSKGYTKEFLEQHPEIYEMEYKKKSCVGEQILVEIYKNIIQYFDVTSDLPKNTQPVLILHGELDNTIECKHGESIAKLLPNSEFFIFPQMSHGINYEIPEDVCIQLFRYFNK